MYIVCIQYICVNSLRGKPLYGEVYLLALYIFPVKDCQPTETVLNLLTSSMILVLKVIVNWKGLTISVTTLLSFYTVTRQLFMVWFWIFFIRRKKKLLLFLYLLNQVILSHVTQLKLWHSESQKGIMCAVNYFCIFLCNSFLFCD